MNNAKLTRGFVAITVAPDMESVEVNWQVTADQAAAFATPNYITSVGVYGPASTTQVGGVEFHPALLTRSAMIPS